MYRAVASGPSGTSVQPNELRSPAAATASSSAKDRSSGTSSTWWPRSGPVCNTAPIAPSIARRYRRGDPRSVAIWSLCVSNGDLVTLLLDIEKEGDQIDRVCQTWNGWMPSAGIVPRRPALKSSTACCSSARVFITNGP